MEIAVTFVLVNLMYMKEKMVIGTQQSARKTKKIYADYGWANADSDQESNSEEGGSSQKE